MRLIVYLSGFLVALCLLISCINTRSNASGDNGKSGKITENKLLGIYKGELPCTDCEAIATVLTLEQGNNYKLEYIYVGKNVDSFSKNGRWKLEDDKLNLEGLDYQYKVEYNQLRQLDLSGREITGDLSDRYILKSSE